MSAEESQEKKIPLVVTLAFIIPPFLAPFILPIKVYGAATLVAMLVGALECLILRKGILKIRNPKYTEVKIVSGKIFYIGLLACLFSTVGIWRWFEPEKSIGLVRSWAMFVWMIEFAYYWLWCAALLVLPLTHNIGGPQSPPGTDSPE